MIRKPLFFILSALVFTVPFSSAFALDARTGDYLSIGSGEIIDEDLFLAGETVTIDGTVNGDLYVAARTIMIRGTVRDSVTVLGNTVTITGPVGHGIHAAVQEMNIEGVVRGNVVALGRSISLGGAALLEGDLIAAGQKIVVSAPLQGYILGAGGIISIGNRVRGDAVFAVRTLTLQEDAVIGGDLIYVSEKEAVIFPGAKIAGRVVHRIPEYRERMKKVFPFIIIAGIVGKIMAFIMMAVVGLVFVLLAPRYMFRFSEAIKQHPGSSAAWGALLLFAVPVGIVIAFTTVVGIALAVIVAHAYLVALYLSQVVTALLIGRLLLGIRDEIAHRGHLFGAFVLGLFLVRLVRFIPGIGIFVWAAAALFGLGAFIVALTKMKPPTTT